MNFSGWIMEQEAKERNSPPERRGIAYIGCVLDESSQHHLIYEAEKFLEHYKHADDTKGFFGPNKGIPKSFSIKAHHMTIAFGSNAVVDDFENSLFPAFGAEVDLLVTDFAADKYCVGCVVRPQSKLPEIESGVPHVTIAHSPEVPAKYTIQLLKTAPLISLKHPLVLKSNLVVVYHNGTVWPELEHLAKGSR
jgi:hypothetical protein